MKCFNCKADLNEVSVVEVNDIPESTSTARVIKFVHCPHCGTPITLEDLRAVPYKPPMEFKNAARD